MPVIVSHRVRLPRPGRRWLGLGQAPVKPPTPRPPGRRVRSPSAQASGQSGSGTPRSGQAPGSGQPGQVQQLATRPGQGQVRLVSQGSSAQATTPTLSPARVRSSGQAPRHQTRAPGSGPGQARPPGHQVRLAGPGQARPGSGQVRSGQTRSPGRQVSRQRRRQAPPPRRPGQVARGQTVRSLVPRPRLCADRRPGGVGPGQQVKRQTPVALSGQGQGRQVSQAPGQATGPGSGARPGAQAAQPAAWHARPGQVCPPWRQPGAQAPRGQARSRAQVRSPDHPVSPPRPPARVRVSRPGQVKQTIVSGQARARQARPGQRQAVGSGTRPSPAGQASASSNPPARPGPGLPGQAANRRPDRQRRQALPVGARRQGTRRALVMGQTGSVVRVARLPGHQARPGPTGRRGSGRQGQAGAVRPGQDQTRVAQAKLSVGQSDGSVRSSGSGSSQVSHFVSLPGQAARSGQTARPQARVRRCQGGPGARPQPRPARQGPGRRPSPDRVRRPLPAAQVRSGSGRVPGQSTRSD